LSGVGQGEGQDVTLNVVKKSPGRKGGVLDFEGKCSEHGNRRNKNGKRGAVY